MTRYFATPWILRDVVLERNLISIDTTIALSLEHRACRFMCF